MGDVLGPTYDDVRAQQRTVQALLVSLAAKAPGVVFPDHAAEWDALAKSALAFASESVSVNPLSLAPQFARGKAVLAQLNAWAGVLSTAPVVNPAPPQGQPRAPYIRRAVSSPGLTSSSMRSMSGKWHSARLATSTGQ